LKMAGVNPPARICAQESCSACLLYWWIEAEANPVMRLSVLVRRMRQEAPVGDGCSDAALLARFVRARDDASFELLVWRHGAMVLAACQRLLRNQEDSEDAFQAVFLVLARKAKSVTRATALPAWLHRVAIRIATRLAGSRRTHAVLKTEPTAQPQGDSAVHAETQRLLDEEINRLPESCRLAVVLHYLEGLSAVEVGLRLGCPTGTIESRLATARKKLRDRLMRRGVTMPAGVMAMLAAEGTLAPEVVAHTSKAAVGFSRGAATTGLASESSVRLAKGVLVMWRSRLLVVAAAFVTIALAATAGLGLTERPVPETAADQPKASSPPGGLPKAEKPEAKQPKADPKADAWGPVSKLGKADGLVYAVSADGNEIVVKPMAEAVTVLDLRTGKTRRVEGKFGGHLGAISYSPNGKYVACAEWNNGATLRDARTWEIIEHISPNIKQTEEFPPNRKHPYSMAAFTPDGKHIAFYCWTWKGGYNAADPTRPFTEYDCQVTLWDVENKKERVVPVQAHVGQALTHLHQGMFNHRPYLYTRIDVSTENGLSASKTFLLANIATNQATPQIALDKDDDGLFDVTPDGKQILVMTAGKDPRLVDVQTGKTVRSFGGHKRLVTTAALSPDGKKVVTASGRHVDGTTAAKLPGGWPPDVGPTEIRIHDTATGELIAAYQNDTLFDFAYIGFSMDAQYVWAQTRDYQLLLWGKFQALPDGVKVDWPVDPQPKSSGGVPLIGSSFDLRGADALDKLIESLPKSGRPVEQQIDAMFLAALGRFATAGEQKNVAALLGDKPTVEKWKQLLDALVKMPEFKAHIQTLEKRIAPPSPNVDGYPQMPDLTGPFPKLPLGPKKH
jgi:RNA polymerase sigma factor (sigma-70 family)